MILSEVYGGKMVRCGCGAAVYRVKVIEQMITWKYEFVNK